MRWTQLIAVTVLIAMPAIAVGQVPNQDADIVAGRHSCIELCGFHSEAELEEFLLTAEVVLIEDIGDGISQRGSCQR